MPARTNEFQKLIYLVKHNLANGATVTESRMLIDLIAGDEVEVDVCVEGSIGDDPVKICIECRDRSRKADKNWVHEMKAKHDRLPTNVLVLASSKGFTKKALELARSYGIQTVTLEEVQNDSFPEILLREGRPDHVWFRIEWSSARAPPMHLQKIEPTMLRRINSVTIEGPCSFTVSGLRLRRGKIGSTQLAWGKTVMFGRDAMVVATRDEHGIEKMSINLSDAALASSVPSTGETAEQGQTEYRH